MRRLLLVMLVVGCSPAGGLDGGSGGGGGTTGTGGGSSGTGGGSSGTGGGSSGTGGGSQVINCPGGAASVVLALYGADGGLQLSPVSDTFTVASQQGPNDVLLDRMSTTEQWRLSFSAPGTDGGLFMSGDMLTLLLAANVGNAIQGSPVTQTLSISRAGQPIAFGSKGTHLTPGLPVGITEAGSPVCSFNSGFGCFYEGRRAVVTSGTSNATLAAGQTAAVGPFVVTVSEYTAYFGGSCDAPNRVLLGGVRVP